MRKMQFTQHLYLIVAPDAVTGRRPFAHAVHREKRRFRIWRGKKRRCRVRFVVFRKNNFATASQFVANQFLHPNPLPNPERDGHEKTFQPMRRISEITMQDAIEFKERLFVKRDVVKVAYLD